eukprot:COSAG05_NODE_3353_length_2129_cov_1.951724_2_plen_51_part_00
MLKAWDETAHVAHYRAKPDEYREALRDFLGGLRAETGGGAGRTERYLQDW